MQAFLLMGTSPPLGQILHLDEHGCEARILEQGEHLIVQVRYMDGEGQPTKWATIEDPEPGFIAGVGDAARTWLQCAHGPCSEVLPPMEHCKQCGTISLDSGGRAACGLPLRLVDAEPGPCGACGIHGVYAARHYFHEGWHLAPLCDGCTMDFPGNHLVRRVCTWPAGTTPPANLGALTVEKSGVDYDIKSGPDTIAVVYALRNRTPAQTQAYAYLLRSSAEMANLLVQWEADWATTPSQGSFRLRETRRLLGHLGLCQRT